MKETWKIIPGYTKYEASSLGNVRHRVNKNNLAKRVSRYGYISYNVYEDHSDRWVQRFAHRLVFMAFNGPINSDTPVDHIDRNKSNNKLDNLRKSTRLENANNKKQIIYPVSFRRIELIISLYENGYSSKDIHRILKETPY